MLFVSATIHVLKIQALVGVIGCGAKTKFLNFKKQCLYLSPYME